jgi:hypothetical protein
MSKSFEKQEKQTVTKEKILKNATIHLKMVLLIRDIFIRFSIISSKMGLV